MLKYRPRNDVSLLIPPTKRSAERRVLTRGAMSLDATSLGAIAPAYSAFLLTKISARWISKDPVGSSYARSRNVVAIPSLDMSLNPERQVHVFEFYLLCRCLVFCSLQLILGSFATRMGSLLRWLHTMSRASLRKRTVVQVEQSLRELDRSLSLSLSLSL